MASTYSTSLRIQLIGTGDQPGVWGTTTNNNLGTLIEEAITGVGAITLTGSTYTLSAYNGIYDESRNAVLNLSGSISADCTVIAPAVQKTYIVKNGTSGGKNVIMSVGSGSTVTVPNGQTYLVFTDGSNFYSANNFNASNVQVTGGTIDGTTIGATTPGNGSFYDLTVYDNATLGVSNASRTVTISTASPALVTVGSGVTPINNARVTFTSSGTLPTGITSGTTYYVVYINSTTFNLSTTSGGTADVNTTSTYTGTISMVVTSDVTFGTPTVNLTTNSLALNGTGALTLPAGTTAQEPTGVAGMIRYNSSTGSFEGYTTAWGSIGGGAAASGAVYENKKTISANYTMSTNYNGESVGPLTINSGVTVTIPSGSRWVIL